MSFNYDSVMKIYNAAEQGLTWSSVSSPPASSLTDYMVGFPKSNPKPSADDLAEYINKQQEEIGAILFVLKSDGTVGAATNKFYITGLTISLKERVQLLESFDASNIHFFDEALRVYGISGTAVDHPSQDIDRPYKLFHQSSLIKMYNEEIRGSVLIRKGSVAVLRIMNHIIYGYPLNFNVQYSSGLDKMSQFNMSIVVTDHKLDGGTYSTTEENLEELYSGSSTVNIAKYGKIISDMNESINEVVLLRKSYNKNSEAGQAIAALNVDSFRAFTDKSLLLLTTKQKDALKSEIRSRINTFKDKASKYISNEGQMSRFLYDALGGNDMTTLFTTLDKDIEVVFSGKPSDTKYDASWKNFMGFIERLFAIQAQLTYFKTNLLI